MSDSDTPLLLSFDIVRQLGIGTPPDLGKPVHADMEPLCGLQAALAVDVHRQHRRLLVCGQTYPPHSLLGPPGRHR